MRMSDITFDKIEEHDLLNSRTKVSGMAPEWVCRNRWGNAIAFGRTRKECEDYARTVLRRINGR